MPQFHVFLNAPTFRELRHADSSQTVEPYFRWQTVPPSDARDELDDSEDSRLLAATFEATNRRISMLYENIIFRDNHEDGEEELSRELDTTNAEDQHGKTEYSAYITWLPTTAGDITRPSQSAFMSRRDGTFLRGMDSRIQPETQETQDTTSYAETGAGASDISIARFPEYHFSLHTLSSLRALEHDTFHSNRGKPTYDMEPPFYTNKKKVNLLVTVLELEGPDTIHIKKGAEAGKEVSILKIIVGDEDGGVCRLTAWREVAEQWGGSYTDTPAPSLKRGDVVYLQNILVSKDSSPPAQAAVDSMTNSSVSLTASPALSSAMSICYRTMPVGDDSIDSKLRPDLRLGYSDAAVRKVAAIVRWFQSIAGLPLL